jgi:hypothetical protein
MISTTWTNAPAGFLGLGSADVRPYPGSIASPVVCPTPAPFQGTGVSAARLRRVTPQVLAQAPTHEQIDPTFGTKNDGTTLGNPSSRRRTS